MYERDWAGPRQLLVLAAIAVGLAAWGEVYGDEGQGEGEPSDDPKAKLADQRFDLIQQRVITAKLQSAAPGFPKEVVKKALFRYSDPARGVLAAGVWKAGEEGRPKMLLAAELYRLKDGGPCLSCEYSSLSPERFGFQSVDMRWSPRGTDYKFQAIDTAPEPDENKLRRSIQLRELAKRFTASEVVGKERCELRLLPQPVDRYTPSAADRADGAMFFLTFGTNPEVVLLIETENGKSWQFSVGRMTGAEEVVVMLDGKKVWTGPPLKDGIESSFTGSRTDMKIPGINAQGKEIDP